MNAVLFHPQFRAMMVLHAKEIIHFLVREGVSFSLLCNIKHIKFDPSLPEHISSTFAEMTLFILAGYTFKSIELSEKELNFEAGFGSENIGSLVTLPYESIVQILIQDNDLLQEIPLFTNVSEPHLYNIAADELARIEEIQQKGLSHSSFALASNPENSRFFKK